MNEVPRGSREAGLQSRKDLASFHGDRWEGERLGGRGRWGTGEAQTAPAGGLTSSTKKRPGPPLRGGEHDWGKGV